MNSGIETVQLLGASSNAGRFTRWSAQEIHAVAHALNARPRKTLDWKALAETMNEYLKSVQQPSVATTG